MDCPRLTTLNATFCANLTNACLAAIPAACPTLHSLSLAYCSTAMPALLPELHRMRALATLDLSYTEVSEHTRHDASAAQRGVSVNPPPVAMNPTPVAVNPCASSFLPPLRRMRALASLDLSPTPREMRVAPVC